MGVVFVVSMPFTVSLFVCAMIDNSGFTNLHSKCASSTVFLLPHLHQCCLLCSERDVMCNTLCMVASLVTRHSCDCHPRHVAYTPHNLCTSLRAMELFECTLYMLCFLSVVTPLVSINQPRWLFHHQVRC